MKKFALIAASLVMFAGCARNDTDDLTVQEGDPAATGTTSAIGSPATSQTGTEATADMSAGQNNIPVVVTPDTEVQPSGTLPPDQQRGLAPQPSGTSTTNTNNVGESPSSQALPPSPDQPAQPSQSTP